MYDQQLVLAAIDHHKWSIIALCGVAMICNYIWFFTAVWCGFRDKVVPIPLFCTLFWLCGDGSVVLRYDAWFNGIGHWYVKLFWVALTVTVTTEVVFLYMTARFGRKEYAPTLTQPQFLIVLGLGVAVFALVWGYIVRLIGDPLFIDYFHLANIAGPLAMIPMVLRRGTGAGTNVAIWIIYGIMVASWFTACALWYGPPFGGALHLAFYATCTALAFVTAWIVARMPRASITVAP